MTSIYSTGTVSVTNGSAAVTGSGTAWAVSLVTGGMFSSAGMAIPIASVNSDTTLTLAYAWPGSTASGADYAIARENSDAANVVDLFDRLSRVLVTLSLAGIHPDLSGTITERDALTLGVDDKGFLFLRAELGVAFVFYRWTGSAWDGPFPVAGDAGSSDVTGTSASSLAIGTGTKTFTIAESARGWSAGARLRASSRASGANFMEGVVTSYSVNTLVLSVDLVGGSGTKTDWNINLAGQTGAAGGVASVNAATGVVTIEAIVHSATGKTTPVDADELGIVDSAASNVLKKLTWANLKATLFASWGALVAAGTSKATPVDADTLAIADSAATNATKQLTWANLKATLFSSWGALVAAGTSKATPVDADTIAISDSAVSNATKKLTWANLKATLLATYAWREVLTANRTYYVRTDGSDSNSGLVNTSGGAFLTIQKAINVVASLDISIYNVIIQVGNGTYTAGASFSGNWVGTGTVTLQGDIVTPTNVVISTTSTPAISASGTSVLIGGFKLTTTTSGPGLYIDGGSVTTNGKMEYGACAQAQIQLAGRGRFTNSAKNYTISGAAPQHMFLDGYSYAQNVSSTITITGTPAFSTAFISCSSSFIQCNANTFSGTATGVRYSATVNGVIQTFGSGATYLPGGTSGTTATQGQYV